MIGQSKYCSELIKKHLNKELVMAKEDNEDFKNSTKCWICDSDYVDNGKVRDPCHITGKYRGSAHRDSNFNLRLNHKIPIVFHNLKQYDSHLIMQELGKFNFEINVITNRLKKYMNFKFYWQLSISKSFIR